ncbi:MAG: hypothetical protein ACRD8U_00380, partial [Pyrinomonadaceae bacterium]
VAALARSLGEILEPAAEKSIAPARETLRRLAARQRAPAREDHVRRRVAKTVTRALSARATGSFVSRGQNAISGNTSRKLRLLC